MPDQEVVSDNLHSQGHADSWVASVPKGAGKQGADGDAQNQDGEGSEQPERWGGTHIHKGKNHISWMQGVNSWVKLG